MNASHPIWPIVRQAIFLMALIAILYMNASHFDVTEIRTIITMFLVGAGAESLPGMFGRKE